jgi:hypothetical protein
MKDVDIDFENGGGEITVTVADAGVPVLKLRVTEFDFSPTRNTYSCFTVGPDSRHKVRIYMESAHTEHEEERGSLSLHSHAMTEGLTIEEVNTYPFREEWYGKGVQTFEPMETF